MVRNLRLRSISGVRGVCNMIAQDDHNMIAQDDHNMIKQDDHNNVLFLSKAENCRESEIKYCSRI